MDGLWDIPLTRSPVSNVKEQKQMINVFINKNKTHYQLAIFYHGDVCSPVIRTLQVAIKNNHLLSWTSINKINFPT